MADIQLLAATLISLVGKTDTHSCTDSVSGSNMVEEESRHERTVFFDLIC